MTHQDKVLWISHRGVREGGVVENTEAAFKAAVKKGFKVLETDLRLTADHHIILCHDKTLERVGGSSVLVCSRSRQQHAQTKLADGQSPLFFDQFAQEFQKQSWILDIKAETAQTVISVLLKQAASLMSLEDFAKKASFVLWSRADETYLRARLPQARIYANQKRCWQAGLSVIWARGLLSGIRAGETFSLPPTLGKLSLYNRKFVKAYQDRGAKVLAFLPRDEVEFKLAVDAEVDEILSDGWYPAL